MRSSLPSPPRPVGKRGLRLLAALLREEACLLGLVNLRQGRSWDFGCVGRVCNLENDTDFESGYWFEPLGARAA